MTLEAGPGLAGLAPCGTALTSEQVGLLAHHVTNAGAVVAYDNDDAGRKAASGAYELLADLRCASSNELMAPVLPRGADPAEVLQVHGPQALRGTLTDRRRLVPLGQRVIEIELEAWAHVLDGAEGRIAAVRAVAPFVAKLPRDGVARQVAWLAERVNLDPTTVTIAVTDALAAAEPARRQRRQKLNDTGRPLRAPPQPTARALCRHVL
jgi:DNA primase